MREAPYIGLPIFWVIFTIDWKYNNKGLTFLESINWIMTLSNVANPTCLSKMNQNQIIFTSAQLKKMDWKWVLFSYISGYTQTYLGQIIYVISVW